MAASTDCRRIVPRLWPFLAGELDPVDRREVRLHVTVCAACCDELSRTQEVRRLLRRDEEAVAPEPVRRRLERFVEELAPEPVRGPRPSDDRTCSRPWLSSHDR